MGGGTQPAYCFAFWGGNCNTGGLMGERGVMMVDWLGGQGSWS